MQTGPMKGIAYFYADNERGVAYFLKHVTRIQIGFQNTSKKDNMEDILKIKSEIVVVSFIDVISGIFCSLAQWNTNFK